MALLTLEESGRKAAAAYRVGGVYNKQDKPLLAFADWLKLPEVTPPLWSWDSLFHRKMIEIADRITLREINKLFLFAPVRHTKTEFWSVRYPVYRMERQVALSNRAKNARLKDKGIKIPDSSYRVMFGTYNQTRANEVSLSARKIAELRLRRSHDKWGVEHWQTRDGGAYISSGVQGGVAGKGADLIIIDDPYKNHSDANSALIRQKVRKELSDSYRTRLEEGGQLIYTFARWHEDDPFGDLVADPNENDWQFYFFPALSETQEERDRWAKKYGLELGIQDPINREPGEPLLPERYSKVTLEHLIKTVQGSHGLYMGHPRPPEGSKFKYEWFQNRISPGELPPQTVRVIYIDKAGTEVASQKKDRSGPSATAMLMVEYNLHTGKLYFVDCNWGFWEAVEREDQLFKFVEKHAMRLGGGQITSASRAAFDVVVEQEPASGGKESAQLSLRNLAGYKAYRRPARGDKILRAEPLQAYCSEGNLVLVQGKWNYDLVTEYVDFPFARMDRVDAGSGAFNWIVERYLNQKPSGRKTVSV